MKSSISDNRIVSAKLAASRAIHMNPALEKAIAAVPTAAESYKSYKIPLTCKFTGLVVGSLAVATVAGHMPMIGQWKESMALHPLFSLQQGALLNFAKNSWFRFCAFSEAESLDEDITEKQELLLRVAALAMLHQLAEIRQDVPWMPTWPQVTSNWNSLLGLSYWKAYLESHRFKFPAIHISKMEPEVDLTSYLQLCWSIKKDYETKVNERIEQEKLNFAEKALSTLRDDLAGKIPRSNKLLWRWFLANLPPRYEADTEGWMRTIFFSKADDNLQNKFTMADIDLFEEIYLCECPTGSTLSHAFLDVLRSKRKILENHFETFEILIPAAITEGVAAGTIGEMEPKLAEYTTRTKWIIAHAKWKLAHTNTSKAFDAAFDKQGKVTVNPSFVPRLVLGSDNEQDEDGEADAVSSAFVDTFNDEAITGELEN